MKKVPKKSRALKKQTYFSKMKEYNIYDNLCRVQYSYDGLLIFRRIHEILIRPNYYTKSFLESKDFRQEFKKEPRW